MLKYNYKIAESIGGRKEQQDFAGATTTKFGFLVVVCDGMGGAKGGATASRMAVNIILQDITNTNYNAPATALVQSVTKANTEIFNRSRADENCRGMGTTVTAILLQKEKATVAHAGDSRVYHLRNPGLFGKTMQKVFRTNDHSKVFELVKRRIINEEQARTSDESNVILRALGIKPEVEVEIKDNIPYLKGDRFLLCTDGVCGAVPENDLLAMLHQKADVETTVNKLIAAIDQAGYKSGGGHDNLTAALIACNANSILKSKISMNTKIIIASLATLLALSLGYTGYNEFERIPRMKKQMSDSAQSKQQQPDNAASITKGGYILNPADSLSKEVKRLSNIVDSLLKKINSLSLTPRQPQPQQTTGSKSTQKKNPPSSKPFTTPPSSPTPTAAPAQENNGAKPEPEANPVETEGKETRE